VGSNPRQGVNKCAYGNADVWDNMHLYLEFEENELQDIGILLTSYGRCYDLISCDFLQSLE
jgi:hypothetical protein